MKRTLVQNEQWDESQNDGTNDGIGYSDHPSDFNNLQSMNPTEFLTSEKDIEIKILALRSVLEQDLAAADLKWSLFVAASNSYRHDSCLMPFPPMFTNKQCKDIEALVNATSIF